MFSLDDLSKSFPHAQVETVSGIALFLYAGLVPLVGIVLYSLITLPGTHPVHVSILGLLSSIVMTLFFTDVIKNTVGRPRPDLIARCRPDNEASRDGLVTIDVCMAPRDYVLQDGWRSFPSGHSSFSFAGLGYLSM